jgi:hypothetical protein
MYTIGLNSGHCIEFYSAKYDELIHEYVSDCTIDAWEDVYNEELWFHDDDFTDLVYHRYSLEGDTTGNLKITLVYPDGTRKELPRLSLMPRSIAFHY